MIPASFFLLRVPDTRGVGAPLALSRARSILFFARRGKQLFCSRAGRGTRVVHSDH